MGKFFIDLQRTTPRQTRSASYRTRHVCRASGMPAQALHGPQFYLAVFLLAFLSHSDGGVAGPLTGRLPQWYFGPTQRQT